MLGCLKSKKKTNEFSYNVPVAGGAHIPGETPILRDISLRNAQGPIEYYDDSTKTMAEIHLKNIKDLPDSEFLGYRKRKEGATDPTDLEEKFTWYTYSQVFDMTCRLGNEMNSLNLAKTTNEFKDFHMKMVAIYSGNNKEFILLDIACSLFNYTTVPIYDTLGEEATEFMFKQTDLETCFTSCKHLKGLHT